MRVRKGKSRQVKAIFRIRGQDQDAVEWPCEGWEQAIEKVRRCLPQFEQRNPWLCFDSQQQKLYVLLDPETEPFLATAIHAPSKVRAATKKGAR